MKLILLLALGLGLGFHASAEIKSAEYYELDGWLGEYPEGFQILSDVDVATVLSPNNPIPGASCTLKKDMVIHPWAQKTSSEFVSLSPISRFKAKKNFSIYTGENSSIKVKKGQEVIQLSYLAEGICRMSVLGKEGDESCLSEDDERAEMISASAFGAKAYFKTTCADGRKAWMDSKSLSELLSEEQDAQVKSAVIIDFGTVEEP